MPSHRTSFPSFGGTTELTICSYLLHIPVSWVMCKPGCLRSIRWPSICHLSPAEHFGSPRFLGSPLVPLPCSRDPGRATMSTATETWRCCPRWSDDEGPNDKSISRLIHTASVPAVYASTFGFPYNGKPRFRLGGSPYRMGFEAIRLL